MARAVGLRELKKIQTRKAISEAAIALFVERGFDNVSVADVAAAAQVSSMTVYNYFPAKEDLVMHRLEDHYEEAAAVVRRRRDGERPLEALRRHFLLALDAGDVLTGLNDDPGYLAFQRMVLSTPSLRLRPAEQSDRAQDSLTAALRETWDSPLADIAAAQVIAVLQRLVVHNLTAMLAGERAGARRPTAYAEAEQAFDLLAHGLVRTPLTN
ncbi:TetR family transcriptional regulator [Nonomuraea sp. NPDC000554]|uniref:TetR/AcrR family transcriptional regulator n=1 Tax=Nonomuraea sp. NPDC000554 TaxID=3154259 RepID=UPI00331BEA5D